MIIEDTVGHQHGHIQVYRDGRWYSDFKQNTPNPWVNCRVKAVYRIDEKSDVIKIANLLNWRKEDSKNRQSNLFGLTTLQTLALSNQETSPLSLSSLNYPTLGSSVPTFRGSSPSSGLGLSSDRSDVGYTFNNGARTSVSGGYSSGPKISVSVSIPCEIMWFCRI